MALTVSLIASNQGSYSDEEFSRFWTNISSEGIFNTNAGADYAVTESSPQAMSVDIDAGQVLVAYTKSGATWKVLAKNSVSVTKTINNNTSGSNRVDAIVVHLKQDEPNALKNNVAEILVVDGSGVSALTDGAIDTSVGDTNWYRLANVTVEDSETIIQDSDIADTREFLTLAKFAEITVDVIAEATTGQGVQVDDFLFREEAGYVTELGSSPTTPPTGDWAFFFKSDGLYIIDDAGSASKVSTGGVSTAQKAEAAASAGELFENTDWNNRLSWKDSGSVVHKFAPNQATIQTTRNFGDATGVVNLAHGLGVVPKYVEIIGRATHIEASTVNVSFTLSSDGWSDGNGDDKCTFVDVSGVQGAVPYEDTSGSGKSATKAFRMQIRQNAASADTRTQEVEITFDATNIIFNWTKTDTGSPTDNETIHITVKVYY